MLRVAMEEVRVAKLTARPGMDPEGWGSAGLASVPVEAVADEAAAQAWLLAPDTISAADSDAEYFENGWEERGEPVIVQDACSSWPAMEHDAWMPAVLAARFEGASFECGEAPEEEASALVTIESFWEYCQFQQDDDPLYLFDGTFESSAPELEEEYSAPSLFRNDLLALLCEGTDDPDARPPWRWLLVGPTRSGSFPHVDPLGTSAWNASVHGRKWWVLFAPGTPEDFIKAGIVDAGGEPGRDAPHGAAAASSAAEELASAAKGDKDSEAHAPDGTPSASRWFIRVLPKIRAAVHAAQSGDLPGAPAWLREARVFEFIQEEGATVFVPSGWHHAVLNVSPGATVAVTQNFASPTNLPVVLAALEKEHPEMALALRAKLSKRTTESAP